MGFLDTVRNRTRDERKAIANTLAIIVLVVLVFIWAVLFFGNIGPWRTPNLGAEPLQQFMASTTLLQPSADAAGAAPQPIDGAYDSNAESSTTYTY